MCAREVNRLHKIFDDGGIKLGGVVSDIDGVSARAMVSALIEGQPIEYMLGLARGRLKQKREDLSASLEGDLSARHLFALGRIQAHIETLRREMVAIDAYLLAAMQPYAWAHQLLQTIPGIDEIAAAMIPIEIGDDMGRFTSPERLACWAALSPGNNESAGKCKSGRTRHGNSIIRIDQAIDYAAMSAKKNAPRWIKQLKAIGRGPSSKPNTVRIATSPFGLSLSKPQEALSQAQGERSKANSIASKPAAASH